MSSVRRTSNDQVNNKTVTHVEMRGDYAYTYYTYPSICQDGNCGAVGYGHGHDVEKINKD